MKLLNIIALLFIVLGCSKNQDSELPYSGEYSKQYVASLSGFGENRGTILKACQVPLVNFIKYSTSRAWELKPEECSDLKKVRNAINVPNERTLFQKVIALSDIDTYMNNVYGGTVGGFVCEASDVKSLGTMYDVFWGLRLDYEGTKFKENGAGYAVIRFYSSAAKTLFIPFCKEMGGTYNSVWPNGGGGFTTSTLGDGGYPEYVFSGYSAPMDGAELYEVTPQGREILRSVYNSSKGGWVTNEIGTEPVEIKKSNSMIRNGVVSESKGVKEFVTTYALYGSNKYIVRGEVEEKYHLTTTQKYDNVSLEVVEKGIYGISVDKSEVEKIWEEKVIL